MRIALLAGANSIHTVRWANGFTTAGHEVHLITQHKALECLSSAVLLYRFPFLGSLGYFLMLPGVRRLLRLIKPDILNAHYASGYGTTARLVGYSPWVLSVWGSDVFDFPYKSPLHRGLIRKNLYAADSVASTSKCMADEILKLTPEIKKIAITPFGVDLASYAAVELKRPLAAKLKLTIGTVKSMHSVYGIDLLIKAFAILVGSLKNKAVLNIPELELRLVGGGEQTAELQMLASRTGVAHLVKFIGHVSHSDVPRELAKLDIFVALSRMESFGVAVIEAGAAGLPVVVSNVGGLPEVVVDGLTGIVVPSEDPAAAAVAMERLVLDETLRFKMGRTAKTHVANYYSWAISMERMLKVYEQAVHQ